MKRPKKGIQNVKKWYDNGGPQNRSKGYYVKFWILIDQHGNGYSAVNVDVWKLSSINGDTEEY